MPFDKDLLAKPYPTFSDNEGLLMQILTYVDSKLYKKLKNQCWKKKKCDELKEEFLELYGQIKAKKDVKTKKRNSTERPFYRIEPISTNGKNLLRRLRRRTYRYK